MDENSSVNLTIGDSDILECFAVGVIERKVNSDGKI